MKFSLFYEIQLPTPWQEGDESRMFRETLEHVELADRLGFHGIWAVEHHFLDDHSLSSAPEVWLAAAAARTRHLRIGHGIVCAPPPFSPPARVAERIATLDQVSGGRVEFGTGESASRMELEAFGQDPDTKRAAYLEAVEQICDMMVMTPYPGHDGEHFRFPCRNVIPKPAQKPHPPLWVAGKPDVAAERGMGCLGFAVMSPERARQEVDAYYHALAERCVPIGHTVNPNVAVLTNYYCHPDEAVARERGGHLDFFGFTIAEYYLKGGVKPGRGDGWGRFQAERASVPALDHGNSTSTIGTPDQVRAHLRGLQAAGVDQVMLMHQGGRMRHDWNCESLELFAREIMPEFVEGEAERERAKAERLAPVIDAALARKQRRPELTDAEVPVIEPYGRFSLVSTDDGKGTAGVSGATVGALGLENRKP